MTTFPFHVALHLFYGTEEVSLFPNKEKSPGFSALGSDLTEHIQFHYYVKKGNQLFLTGADSSSHEPMMQPLVS